ncbi:hypothetical protein PAXRUDRAFT_32236 [Paxillus rubicundulus Ve08.2h10]|uniref:DUF6697 domain-containing protein n=1 Tax=Paxillus rubicundulus Ve08.2h10 TaxID=930991 RepID=A0A0D0E0A2_9AGAM|nr:hypothetical protein PAXRUDRAFT_32236 [Paxillus rubicundulus Ve08.2h10]
MAEQAHKLQMEKLHVAEALAARDNVVVRLEDAYTSVRQKAATILRLEQELECLKRASTPANTNTADVRIVSGFLATRRPHDPDPGKDESTVATRQDALAALPLPTGIPDDALQPIILPAPCSLHEFLGNTSGDVLTNHRILAQLTTYWCPEREEHGYFLTPVFKCSTNPRVATAHRWLAVDVIGQMSSPTECFYNKDGKWYYAGTYKAFRMDDLTTQEWEGLSTETTQAIVKETLAGRKNVSPQNHYETAQLYAVGALRVACIGLQCVGFSEDVYRGVLEQSRFGYWRRTTSSWTPTRTPTARSETTSDDAIPAAR